MGENYRVGQILFVIPVDNAIVVPVQVIERRISETVSGAATKHIIKTSKEKAPPMVLETVKGMIFSDIRQVRDIMLRNATREIDRMVQAANADAQKAFAPPRQVEPEIQDDIDQFGAVFVDDEVAPRDEQLPSQTPTPVSNGHDVGMTEIMMPDGKKQKVMLKGS